MNEAAWQQLTSNCRVDRTKSPNPKIKEKSWTVLCVSYVLMQWLNFSKSEPITQYRSSTECNVTANSKPLEMNKWQHEVTQWCNAESKPSPQSKRVAHSISKPGAFLAGVCVLCDCGFSDRLAYHHCLKASMALGLVCRSLCCYCCCNKLATNHSRYLWINIKYIFSQW